MEITANGTSARSPAAASFASGFVFVVTSAIVEATDKNLEPIKMVINQVKGRK